MLENYDVQSALEFHFNSAAPSENYATFSSLALEQKPIEFIHQLIRNDLSAQKEQEKNATSDSLKQKAIETQRTADNDESIEDQAKAIGQANRRDYLLGERGRKENQLQQRRQVNVSVSLPISNIGGIAINPIFRNTMIMDQVFSRPAGILPVNYNPSLSTHNYYHPHYNNSQLEKELRNINNEVASIDNDINARTTRNRQREARQKARENLLANNGQSSIDDALSVNNRQNLKLDIRITHSKLEDQYNTLVQKALDLNYPTYLRTLSASLQAGNLPLSAQEQAALSRILYFVNRNLALQKTLKNAKNELQTLCQKNLLWTNTETGAKNEVQRLRQSNIDLARDKDQLASESTTQARLEIENKDMRNKLLQPTWLSAAATPITCAPLILMFLGVLPPITPLLALTLAVASSIALLGTVACGIAALVYHSSSETCRRSKEWKAELILRRTATIATQEERIKSLEEKEIALCSQKILDNLTAQEGKKQEIEQIQSQAVEALEEARKIRPDDFAAEMVMQKSEVPMAQAVIVSSNPNAFLYYNSNPVPSVPVMHEDMDEVSQQFK